MKFDIGRLRDEPEISLTSLIDVVFTLIIFFVVTTTFDVRSSLQLELPRADAPTTAEPGEALIVVVDAEGRFFVNDNEVLKRDAESLKEAVLRVAGEDREQRVELRADARTPYQSVVTAMNALGQLGFNNLALPTQPETDR